MGAETTGRGTVPSPTSDGRGRRRRVHGRAYAAFMYTVTAAYFGQAVLAGQFLSGSYDALRWHRYGATFTDGILFCALVTGALLRWHAKGRRWPFLAALTLLLANQAQNGAGAARMVSLHIPLGVAMIVGAFVAALQARHAGAPADREAGA